MSMTLCAPPAYLLTTTTRAHDLLFAQLCKECAELNWTKRTESCNLYGRVALVTGSRVKIGFRIALKLLRCGRGRRADRLSWQPLPPLSAPCGARACFAGAAAR